MHRLISHTLSFSHIKQVYSHNGGLSTLRWLGGVVASVSDSWSRGQLPAAALSGNDLGQMDKLFTSMCLCSPSSIIWYLARAFMSMRLYVAANGMGPMNKGVL